MTFNKSKMPCMESEEQQKIVRKESPGKVEWMGVHIPTIPSKVESNTQHQQNIELEGDVILWAKTFSWLSTS